MNFNHITLIAHWAQLAWTNVRSESTSELVLSDRTKLQQKSPKRRVLGNNSQVQTELCIIRYFILENCWENYWDAAGTLCDWWRYSSEVTSSLLETPCIAVSCSSCLRNSPSCSSPWRHQPHTHTLQQLSALFLATFAICYRPSVCRL